MGSCNQNPLRSVRLSDIIERFAKPHCCSMKFFRMKSLHTIDKSKGYKIGVHGDLAPTDQPEDTEIRKEFLKRCEGGALML